MRVTAIELDPIAKTVQVQLMGDKLYVRNFSSDSFQPADVERFMADVSSAMQVVRDCRAIFMSQGNILSFPTPQADGDGGEEPKVH